MSFTLTGTLKDFGSGIPAGVEGYVQADRSTPWLAKD